MASLVLISSLFFSSFLGCSVGQLEHSVHDLGSQGHFTPGNGQNELEDHTIHIVSVDASKSGSETRNEKVELKSSELQKSSIIVPDNAEQVDRYDMPGLPLDLANDKQSSDGENEGKIGASNTAHEMKVNRDMRANDVIFDERRTINPSGFVPKFPPFPDGPHILEGKDGDTDTVDVGEGGKLPPYLYPDSVGSDGNYYPDYVGSDSEYTTMPIKPNEFSLTGWVKERQISDSERQQQNLLKAKSSDVLTKIDASKLIEDNVDIDALYENVKMEPDTVIDEEDGIMIFRNDGSMFEIDGLNQLRPETTMAVEETTTSTSSPDPTFVIMKSSKDGDTGSRENKTPKQQQAFKSNLNLMSSNGWRKPATPMTSHGLLGRDRRPGGGLVMATGASSRDPTCPPVNGSTDMVLSDGFYRKVSGDRVEVLATSVFLDEESAIYDPCKDFYLQAVTLTVKGHIKWKGRNVYITAVNLTVVGDKATIDASFQSPGQPDYHLPAEDGVTPGEAGHDGAQGGKGQQGGEVKMHVAFLFGGQLEVKSLGGQGGKGQDGGNGREGAAGSPNTDYDACCRGRSTQGHQGGKGGNAGKPGKSGDGGRGGDIEILQLNTTWDDLQLFRTTAFPLVDVNGGEPGPPASAGQPGPGGPGGMGSKTSCKTHGALWWKKKKCEGSNGAYGAQGDMGGKAPSATSALKGQAGKAIIRNIEIEEFAKYISKEMVQTTLREGNRHYKKGDFVAAKDMYVWIYITNKGSDDEERQKYANQALIYLQQLSHGLDYWAHGPNNMPMSSYNSIFSYLTADIVPYARDVEADYNMYFDKATEIQRKQSIIKESIEHNRFNMDVLSKTKDDRIDELGQVKGELDELIHHQREARVSAEGISANCKNAVDIYLVKQKAKMIFKDILNIIGAAIKIFTLAFNGFSQLTNGFGEFVGALDSIKGLKDKSIFDQIKGIDTVVKNIEGIYDQAKGTIETTLDSIEEQYLKIKDTLEKTGAENSVKIVADGKELQKLLDKYLFLPECTDAKSQIQTYIDISQSVNEKILHHDSMVLRIAAIDAQYDLLKEEGSRLRSELSKGFDPTVIDYAIAIGRIYTDLKDSIVDQMKRLQEAYNYQFLENRVFKFDDTRVALLEAWLANNRIHMIDKIEKLGSEVQTFNLDSPPMINSIVIKREDNPNNFEEFDRTGELPFTITGTEEQLAPLTHAHMLDVRVWLPGVKVDDDRLRVWLKRYGTSTVYDQNGQPWTFTHSSRTMLFDYNVNDLTRYSRNKSPSQSVIYIENTHISIDERGDYVALSPIGPWALSVSPVYNPNVDTRKVKEIYIQMAYSFLPCSLPVCPPRTHSANYTSDDEPDGPHVPVPHIDPEDPGKTVEEPGDSQRISVGTLVGIILAGILTAVILVAIGTISYRRRRQDRGDYDNVSMVWDYSESGSSTERSPLNATRTDSWNGTENEPMNSNAANA
ncbi:uncharacterized protein LOC144433439 [Glandiceps talaboti]